MKLKDIKEVEKYTFEEVFKIVKRLILSRINNSTFYKELFKRNDKTLNLLNNGFTVLDLKYLISNNLPLELNKCEVCGKDLHVNSFKNGFPKSCSKECALKVSIQKMRNVLFEQYGTTNTREVPGVNEKIKNTCKEKYGVENLLCSEEIKEKIRNTCIERYGVDNPFACKEIHEKTTKSFKEHYGIGTEGNKRKQEKRKNTCIEKYGVEFPSQLESVKNKIKETNLERYGVESFLSIPKEKRAIKIDGPRKDKSYERLFTIEEFEPAFDRSEWEGHSSTKLYSWKCKKCGHIFEHTINGYYTPRCPICYPTKVTKGQQEIVNYITDSFNVSDIKINTRSVISFDDKKLELDIFVKEYNKAIEYHGSFWHSSLFDSNISLLQIKNKSCSEKSIKLIHFIDEEWKFKNKASKNLLEIYFSKEIVTDDISYENVTLKEAEDVFYENSIYGILKTPDSKFTLFYNKNEIIGGIQFVENNLNVEILNIFSCKRFFIIDYIFNIFKNKNVKIFIDLRFFDCFSSEYTIDVNLEYDLTLYPIYVKTVVPYSVICDFPFLSNENLKHLTDEELKENKFHRLYNPGFVCISKI